MTSPDNGNGGNRNGNFLGMTHGAFYGICATWIAMAVLATIIAIAFSHKQAQTNKLVQQGVQAHVANCALKDDLQARIQQETDALQKSKTFFATHPNALPDIPRATIRQGWDTQQAVIDGQSRTAALLDKALSCGTG